MVRHEDKNIFRSILLNFNTKYAEFLGDKDVPYGLPTDLEWGIFSGILKKVIRGLNIIGVREGCNPISEPPNPLKPLFVQVLLKTSPGFQKSTETSLIIRKTEVECNNCAVWNINKINKLLNSAYF